MNTKRIEYIDALRGFSMYLVVYAHIWTFGYHADNKNSFDHILLNFFLVLFFFVSGFVAFKKDQEWSLSAIGKNLKKKAVQLLVPSVAFTTLLYATVYHHLAAIQHIALAEYWFTVQLFIFFPVLLFHDAFLQKDGRNKTKYRVAHNSIFHFYDQFQSCSF